MFGVKFDKDGNYITNPKYTEIIRLHKMLTEAGISHSFEKIFDGWQICYPSAPASGEDCVMDAVQHFGSYGKDESLLEIMGLLTEEEKAEWDSVAGYLTAKNVFGRIKKHWDETQNPSIRAIKEFANRLRSHYPHTNSILKRIDVIEKEMIEEAQK